MMLVHVANVDVISAVMRDVVGDDYTILQMCMKKKHSSLFTACVCRSCVFLYILVKEGINNRMRVGHVWGVHCKINCRRCSVGWCRRFCPVQEWLFWAVASLFCRRQRCVIQSWSAASRTQSRTWTTRWRTATAWTLKSRGPLKFLISRSLTSTTCARVWLNSSTSRKNRDSLFLLRRRRTEGRGVTAAEGTSGSSVSGLQLLMAAERVCSSGTAFFCGF